MENYSLPPLRLEFSSLFILGGKKEVEEEEKAKEYSFYPLL